VPRRSPGVCRSLAAISLLLPLSSFDAEGTEAHPPEDIEEVQVLASRIRLAELRTEIVKVEDDFYDRLNELLDDPEFRVGCSTEPSIGTRISRRKCGPQYVATSNANYAREIAQALALAAVGGTYSPPTPPGVSIAGNEVVLVRKVNDFIRSDVKLRSLAQRRASLEALLKETQRARSTDVRTGTR
jgi:hypothetical protein